jgi:Rrf2 family nitric oxide-sensitive transcriptional repressor
MRLTTFTDYSLRVLIYLAARPEQRATIAQVAQAFEVSENHLVKVVHFLARHGWVQTLRGKGGGMTLARAPQLIRVGDVVRDTEGAAMPAECFSPQGSHCAIAGCCRLSGVLGRAVAAFYAELDRHTLEDITRNRRVLAGILHIAPAL